MVKTFTVNVIDANTYIPTSFDSHSRARMYIIFPSPECLFVSLFMLLASRLFLYLRLCLSKFTEGRIILLPKLSSTSECRIIVAFHQMRCHNQSGLNRYIWTEWSK